MALIALDDVHKTYASGGEAEVRALRGVSLTIDKGEFVAIMGSSGSGKSTLMNILGLLDRPTRGRYLLAEREVSTLSKNELAEVRNRMIGFVFQSFNLLPYATALENVALPLLFAGVPDKKRNERAKEMLERVGLGERIDHKPTELSGGQMQRVAIARALANNPAIILADEPTGNLDSASGHAIADLFGELHAAGQTIVMITHDSGLAKIASRSVHIRDGEIVDDTGARAAA